MTHLILIRHGETDWNVTRRFQGVTDTALNAVGREQAARLGVALAEFAFDACYSSDLQRVMDTARIALGVRAEVARPDPRLREISFGVFEGLTYDEIKMQYPAELATWEEDREQNTHGGERLSEVIARVGAVSEAVRAAHPGERVVIFGHGGTLGILLALALGAPPEKWWQFRLHNTSITELALYDGGAILTRFNDSYHLAGMVTPDSA